MTKVDIVSGFLGAGKTTLIKKLIEEVFAGEKLVLIENEFGEIGIDGGFLKDAGVNITEMNSGCICCTLVGDFSKALAQVLTEYTPDRVIIEPSGVGKLSDVIKAIEGIREEQPITIEGKIAVVDGKKAKTYLKNFGEFYKNQVESASTIVMSRTQMMTDEKIEESVHLIREINPDAALITTPWDQLGKEAMLNALTNGAEVEGIFEEGHHHHHHHEHDGECCCGHDHDHEHHDHGKTCCCGDDSKGHDSNYVCGAEQPHHHDHDRTCGCEEHHHDHDGEYRCCCHDGDHEHDHDKTCGSSEHQGHDSNYVCGGEHEHHHEHGEGCTCGCHDHEHEHEHHHEHGEGCTCGCHDHHHHHADEVFTSWGKETAHKYTETELDFILKALSETECYGTILRAKGIIAMEDGTWTQFDMVPEEYEVRKGQPDYTGRICVIGTDLKEDQLKELFHI